MERGEIWSAAYEGYASKPRPVLIIQSDTVADDFQSTVTCLFTSYASDHIFSRVRVEPTEENGLCKTSWVLTDKIFTMPVEQLKKKIGRLSEDDMSKVSESLRYVLGL